MDDELKMTQPAPQPDVVDGEEADSPAADGSVTPSADDAGEGESGVTSVGQLDAHLAQGSDQADADADADAPADFADPHWQQSPIPASTSRSIMAQHASAFDDLDAWGKRHQLGGDPYLDGLLAAHHDRDDLSMWASLDPFEHLPHPEARSGSLLRGTARLLIFLRNVTVFAPVAITWYSIRVATEAFGDYADALDKQGQGAEINFLRFWQDGGDGTLAATWRIQHVALLDAILIALMIVATLVAGVLDNRGQRKRARAERTLDAERSSLALRVKRALHGKRQATTESIAESLGESLSDLMSAARMVNVAALRMEAMSVGLESVGPRLDAMNSRVADLNTRIGSDLQRAIDSLSTSVKALGGTVSGDLAQTIKQVLIGLDEIREQLGRTSASVEFGTKNLREDLDAIHSRLGAVVRGRP